MRNELKILSDSLKENKKLVSNEAQTRAVLIDPFLKWLGYSTANPSDVEVEYICDIGTKKGERIDYALKKDGEVTVLIEAKGSHVVLDEQHLNQLIRYYGVSKATIGILTNGLEYRFYTDSFRKNVLDSKPFYIFNILDYTDKDVDVLAKFSKSRFNVPLVESYANELSYKQFLFDFLEIQMQNPSDELLSLMLDSTPASLNRDKLRSAVTEGLVELLEGLSAVENSKVLVDKKALTVDGAVMDGVSNLPNDNSTPSSVVISSVDTVTLADLEREAKKKRLLAGKPIQIKIDNRSYTLSHWYELVFYACKWLKDENKFNAVFSELKEGRNAWLSDTKPDGKEANYKYNPELNLYLHINTVSRDMVTRTIRILSLAGVDKEHVSVRIKK